MFTFHAATPDDAEDIATVVSEASCGIVEHLLGGLIPGLGAVTLLGTAFMQGEGVYSTDNVILSRTEGRITGLLLSYPAEAHSVPPLLKTFVTEKRLAAIRPVLEQAEPKSWYINTLWVEGGLENNIHADALLLEARSRSQQTGCTSLSVFCWKDNTAAHAFYARHKFTEGRTFSPELLPLEGHSQGGVLLVAPVA